MQKSLVTFILLSTPSIAFAQVAPETLLDQGHCEGKNFVMQSEYVTAAAVETMAPHLMPVPEGAFLMRFENDDLDGETFFHWSTDRSGYMEETYCSDVYYRQRFPQEGNWSFEAQNVTFTGCPEAMDPTKGLTSEIEVLWDFSGPNSMFERFPMAFTMTEIDPLHWIATADAMPNIPGTVAITYDMTATSPTQIDIDGVVDMNITAGDMQIACSGTLEMIGHPVN